MIKKGIAHIGGIDNLLKFNSPIKTCTQFAYDYAENDNKLTQEALNAAFTIRGTANAPCLFLHGAMQRSGTVYAAKLINQHPDVHGYPNSLWELPFLKTTGHLLDAQHLFFDAFKINKDKMGRNDLLPLFGSAIVAYLNSFIENGKNVLIKEPSVDFLHYFDIVFPYEHLILLIRDGRDVVSSTIKTWPKAGFKQSCMRWRDSANMIWRYIEDHQNEKKDGGRFLFYKFEDILKEPSLFIKKICKKFNLHEERYPLEKVGQLTLQGSSTIKVDDKVTWKGVEKPKNFNPIGRWGDWDSRKKTIFKKIAGDYLIKFGYAENNSW